MGNRATVIFWNGEHEPAQQRFSPAVYLHWNGGPESVYAFLEELDRRDVRADQDYEAARFVQLVGEFVSSSYHDEEDKYGYRWGDAQGLSLGVVNGPASDALEDLSAVQTDHGDNGFYLVDRTGKRTKVRRFLETCTDPGTWSHWEFRELMPAKVAAERHKARKSDYAPELREFYARLHPHTPREVAATATA